jgi:hypothetical protein
MNTKIVDTPSVNLREEAAIVSIQVTPETLFVDIVVTSTDLTTGRVLGTRRPVKPPLPNGMPAPIGIPISSLPNGIQNRINFIADHFINEPGVFN